MHIWCKLVVVQYSSSTSASCTSTCACTSTTISSSSSPSFSQLVGNSELPLYSTKLLLTYAVISISVWLTANGDQMPRVPCSLYPLASTPPNVLLRVAGEPCGWKEEAAIAGSSLFIVGSFLWVPALYVWAYRKWKAVKDPRRKALYGALLLAGTALFVAGPHRRPSFGQRVGFQKWKIWKIWCQFVALEIWNDSKQSAHEHYKKSQSITAFVPHGIFPFSIGLAAIPEIAAIAFGRMRIMVATATNLFPFVRDIISLVHSV
jgi:hypothetical protein